MEFFTVVLGAFTGVIFADVALAGILLLRTRRANKKVEAHFTAMEAALREQSPDA